MASPKEKVQEICVNLAEVLNPEILEAVYAEGRVPRIYWGTAPTGKPHCGYFVPACFIAQFLQAGCEVVILLADIHAFLDNLKAPIELVNHRTTYYKYCVTSMLEAIGVSVDKLEFVTGSSYQTSGAYTMDVYRLASITSEHDARKAGAEIVKQSGNPPLSGLLYPTLQVLDEEHLKVDAQFGGVDQRKLFTAAKEWLPRLGYKARAHLINPLVPGLGEGGKMSSSDENSKIDLLDPPDVVIRKIKKAVAAPMVVEGNALLAFTEFVLLPAARLGGGKQITVDRSRDNLEPLVYDSIAKMQEDYKNDVLTPQLLKQAATKGLNDLLAPIQAKYNASKEWQEVTLLAYPPPPEVKKEKKVKNKGTKHPGPNTATVTHNPKAEPDSKPETESPAG